MAMTDEDMYLEGKLEGLRTAVEALARYTLEESLLREYISLLRSVGFSSVNPDADPEFQRGFEDTMHRMATHLRESA